MIFSLISVFIGQAWFNISYGVESSAATATQVQKQKFISVEGSDFNARFETALQQGRKTAPKFWVAYSFDVRPGVLVDADFSRNGNVVIVNGTTTDPAMETRNLGIFLLHDANEVVRVETYNLERQREYSSYPVYWLGRANNQESLQRLKKILGDNQPERINEQVVRALALHDDPSIGGLLKGIVETAKNNKLRKSALTWLGDFEVESAFLLQIARTEAEPLEIRKQAVFALGRSKDNGSLGLLQNLYATDISRELKRQILFAVTLKQQQEAAIDFLIKQAESESDRELKKQALFWLGQKAGARSLRALTDVVEKNDAETEVQKQAVFALSQRPKDEAVPALLKVARDHKSMAVRKQALFWLGQSGDQRALEYFKEVLTQ